jgi:hypothetical protein
MTQRACCDNEAAPRQGAAFLFKLFARQVDSAEPCARSSSLCSLLFVLSLLFHDSASLLALSPSRNNGNWEMNAT